MGICVCPRLARKGLVVEKNSFKHRQKVANILSKDNITLRTNYCHNTLYNKLSQNLYHTAWAENIWSILAK